MLKNYFVSFNVLVLSYLSYSGQGIFIDFAISEIFNFFKKSFEQGYIGGLSVSWWPEQNADLDLGCDWKALNYLLIHEPRMIRNH